MSLKKIVDVGSVNGLLKKGIINRDGVRLIDCSYALTPRQDYKQFEKENFGKFEKLLAQPSPSHQLYLNSHIPEAVHINLDIAMFPSKFQRFTHYAPEVFEQYAQIVGLNQKEHFIFYGKGAMGGMLFASKVAWLFKTYGHENVSLVDGGFEAWKRQNFEVSSEDVKLPKGNWQAFDKLNDHVITFEELEDKNGGEKQYIEKTSEVNFLDSRGRGQFNGTEDSGLDPHKVNGTRIAGFKNTPSAELLEANGQLKNEKQINAWLLKNGYTQHQPIVTSCNSGVQAALLAYAIDSAVPDANIKLYNGSLKEMELRDPKKISEGPQHLPH